MAKRIRVSYWAGTLAVILMAAVLAWQCIDIYRTGNSPANLDANGVHLSPVFSAEIVAARLQPILPLLAVCVLVILAALIVQSTGKAAPALSMTAENRLRLMKKRVKTLPAEAEKEERLRRNIRVIAAAAVAVCAVPCLAYLLNGEHFTSWDLETVMGQMLLRVTPWVALAFAAIIAANLACGRSAAREAAALQGRLGQPVAETAAPRRVPVGAVRVLLYAVAVVFIVLGVMNGGLRDVLVKAINICTECIGLG